MIASKFSNKTEDKFFARTELNQRPYRPIFPVFRSVAVFFVCHDYHALINEVLRQWTIPEKMADFTSRNA